MGNPATDVKFSSTFWLLLREFLWHICWIWVLSNLIYIVGVNLTSLSLWLEMILKGCHESLCWFHLMPTCFPTRSSRKVCKFKRQLASFDADARINSFSGLGIAFLTKLWSERAASNFTLNARFHILINTTYAASAWQRISFCIFFCCTNPLRFACSFQPKKRGKNVQNMLLPSTTAREHKLGLSPFTSHRRIVGED